MSSSSSKTVHVKCQHPECVRQGFTFTVLPSGERILTVKNTRHDGKPHARDFALDEIILSQYSLQELEKLYETNK